MVEEKENQARSDVRGVGGAAYSATQRRMWLLGDKLLIGPCSRIVAYSTALTLGVSFSALAQLGEGAP